MCLVDDVVRLEGQVDPAQPLAPQLVRLVRKSLEIVQVVSVPVGHVQKVEHFSLHEIDQKNALVQLVCHLV